MRLRDLIKTVRGCKTSQTEREVIAKESAAIRTAIANDDNEYRPRNVAKLLYIHMLGYSTSWGQMECLKLIASPHYSDKRVGYLGAMVLLDETQEVLMLATNHMKHDLTHHNQYVVGLSLTALANICSSSIARDTSGEVEKLLSSSNPYIRKKAALCALRIIRKVPDLMENFLPKLKPLLNSKNHGVLVSALSLIIELSTLEDGVNLPHVRKLLPQLIRIQRHLCQSGYAPEYDISGVTDPFLQVKLLRMMKLVGEGDAGSSENMNDLLAQVATNTDSMRNVGNAVLYECVNTIMSINAENGLRVLAVNILGRFLGNRDNNIRYVALNTLCRVVNVEPDAVQRHRNTIVDCLKDNDISIRRRALELIYSLVNSNNVRVLVRELLNYLLVADVESRPTLTAKLCVVAEKFAPTKRWQVDTILKVMALSGNYVPDEVCSNLIALIAQTPELQSYAVHKMYLALTKDSSQQSLVQVGVWCLGEFGDLLAADEDSVVTDDGKQVKVTEQDIVNLFESMLRSTLSSPLTKVYIVTAATKLTTRFSDPSTIASLHKIVKTHTTSPNLELQARACEFSQVLEDGGMGNKLFDRMPAPEIRSTVAAITPPTPRRTKKEDNTEKGKVDKPTPTPKKQGGSDLIDFDLEEDVTGTSTPSPTPSNNSNPMDVLSKIFPTGNNSPSPTPSSPVLMGGGGGGGGAAGPTSFPAFTAFQSDSYDVVVTFQPVKQPSAPHLTLINASFTNTGPSDLENFDFQAAVPVYLKLQLAPASGTTVPRLTMGTVTQSIKIANTEHGKRPVILKIRMQWTQNGEQKTAMGTVNNFPPGV